MCHRLIIGVLAAGLLLSPSDTRAAEGDLTLPDGAGVVPVPGEGFKWEKVRENPEGETPRMRIFLASKENSNARVVLIVEHAPADTDAKKIARIKGAYNGMVSMLKEQGHTELKGTRPSIEPPIPERVSFIFTGKSKDGTPAAFGGALRFGKNAVYNFQIFAPTEAEVTDLAKVADAVKE